MAKFIVAGGGIGGLATALSVSQHGHEVVVAERGAEFAELGAGIQLAPNGIHALHRLGVGDAVRDAAVHIDGLRFMDGVSGDHVTTMPLTEGYRRRFGNPYVVVHRGELYKLLLDACAASENVTLRPDSRVTRYHQRDGLVTAELADGAGLTADALIGADGIHSAVREWIVGDGAPRVSGITIYRAIIPMERVPERMRSNTVTWWAGPHCHFVHYAIGGGKYLNLAASSDNQAETAIAGVPTGKATVRDAFAMMAEFPRGLLELGEDWKAWVLIDRDPVDNWTDGRVTLLGDAAHPMIHYAAQGACQALEDAVHLGDLLDCSAGEIGQRFEKYNAGRAKRTADVQLTSRESIKLWHPEGEAARARNELLAGMSDTRLHDRIAWMHGYTGEA